MLAARIEEVERLEHSPAKSYLVDCLERAIVLLSFQDPLHYRVYHSLLEVRDASRHYVTTHGRVTAAVRTRLVARRLRLNCLIQWKLARMRRCLLAFTPGTRRISPPADHTSP